jgi:hypothetical protein
VKKLIVLAMASVLVTALIAACATEPTPVPPTQPAPPTSAPVQPTALSPSPTAVPPTSAPAQPTNPPPTPIPPTAIPPTQAPTAAPTNTPVPPPTVVPGLYVNDLQLTPAQPAFNQNISFKATFNNATGSEKTFRWKVYIWRADIVTKTDGETSAQTTIFPVGTADYPALGTYRYGPTGRQCEYFFARVGWLDANNQVHYFTSSNGKVYEKGFPICDASIIPTAVPQAAAPTAAPAPPGPGLFVTNMQLIPNQPAFNQNISFMPTFNNTSNAVQTFTWKVYIWRADTPSHTDNETTAQKTSFPVGTGDYASLGSYRYGPTGNLCEYFFARVGWLDANNQVTYFTTPTGQVYEKGFAICDSSIIPTAVPQAPPPTLVPPSPAPGLFVTGLRLQPFDQPQHNMDTTFFVTFLNNSNTVQNFTWKVYIFKADSPAKSNTDLTGVFTSFPVGSKEVQAGSTFRYGPTGNQCDYFFARVGFLDANNNIIYFSQPNGQIFQKGFQVCN